MTGLSAVFESTERYETDNGRFISCSGEKGGELETNLMRSRQRRLKIMGLSTAVEWKSDSVPNLQISFLRGWQRQSHILVEPNGVVMLHLNYIRGCQRLSQIRLRRKVFPCHSSVTSGALRDQVS